MTTIAPTGHTAEETAPAEEAGPKPVPGRRLRGVGAALLDRRPARLSIDLTVGVIASLAGSFAVAYGIGRFPALDGDEGIYTEQAWSILHGTITPYTYTYDHPFLGWAQLAPLQAFAHWARLGGGLAVVNGRAVMVAYAAATLLLTYGIARRLRIRIVYAALSVLLLGLSPLYVVEARQVYLDNLALPWVLGAFNLALSARQRQWTYVVAGLLFAVGVLSKETVLLFLPAVLYLVWTRAYRPIRSMSVAGFVTVGTLGVLTYPLFAVLRKELIPGPGHVSLLSNGVAYQLSSRKGSGVLWQAGSERRLLLDSWLYYDHVLPLAGVLCAAVCLGSKNMRVLALAVGVWLIPVVKPGGYLPAMYIIAVLPFCALAIGAVLELAHRRVSVILLSHPLRVAQFARRRSGPAAVGACVLIAALVAPHYLRGDRAISTAPSSAVTAAKQAEAYVFTHVPRRDNVLTDPAFWSDLVDAGFGQPWHGAISYYQFDLDPISSGRNLPNGWQNLDYLIVTEPMRQNIPYLKLTKLQLALAHSSVVGSWGSGSTLIEVRKVVATPFNHNGVSS